MKFKSLMALLVVFTMIMTGMVCSADGITVTTTAQYRATTGSSTYSGLTVTTEVSGATPDSMIAYAIYATGTANEEDGSMTESDESNIVVNADGSTNLVYIDQATVSAQGTATFETQPYTGAYAKMAGAKVKLGSSNADDQAAMVSAGTNTAIINQTNTCYAIVAPATTEWDAAQIASVNVDVTSVGVPYSCSITTAGGKVYIPVGSTIKITLVPNSGYALDEGGYSLGTTDMGITSTNSSYTGTPTATQGETLVLTLPAGVASTPAEYLTLDKEPIVADSAITYYMNNKTGARAGIDVTITKKADTSVKLVLNNLDMVDFNNSNETLSGYCGIQIINDPETPNAQFAEILANIGDYTLEMTPYYYDDGGNKKAFTSQNGNTYTK